MAYEVKPLTVFETDLVNKVTASAGQILEKRKILPAYNNARGFRSTTGNVVLNDWDVNGVKYGASICNAPLSLIKNFRFRSRRSTDRFGSGIFYDTTPTTPNVLAYVSNAWIDLMHPEPINDYNIANNEGLDAENSGPNSRIFIRESVFLNGEDAGLDVKTTTLVDSTFIASGHRSIRIWGSDLTLANCVILAFPGFLHFGFHGVYPTTDIVNVKYFNCKFGFVGQDPSLYTDTIVPGMYEQSLNKLNITKLTVDPFNRSSSSFFVPGIIPKPEQYTPAIPSKEELIGRKFVELIKTI